jgi:hypothetical protein
MRPDRITLISEKEVGIELVGLDGDIAINNVLLFYIVATTKFKRWCRPPGRNRLEYVLRDGSCRTSRPSIEWRLKWA